MPVDTTVLTVTSGTVANMGTDVKAATFFARYTLHISDGSIRSYDRPNERIGANTTAQLNAIIASCNADLASVPSLVTLSQIRQAVVNAGIQAAVDAAIAAAPATTQAQWYSARTIDRHDDAMNAVWVTAGLSTAEMDGLFRMAGALP